LPVLGHYRVICVRRLADIQVPLASAGRTVLVMDPDPAGAGPLGLQHAVLGYRSDEDTRPGYGWLACGEPARVCRIASV
jgi:hypothetical protein